MGCGVARSSGTAAVAQAAAGSSSTSSDVVGANGVARWIRPGTDATIQRPGVVRLIVLKHGGEDFLKRRTAAMSASNDTRDQALTPAPIRGASGPQGGHPVHTDRRRSSHGSGL